MRFRTVAPALLALTAAATGACQKSPQDRLQGRWVGQRVENFPASHAARAHGWATHMSFEFSGNEVRVAVPAESPREGTYKIAKVEQNELTVTFLRPHGGTDTAAFVLEGDDTLRWKLADGRSIVLRKTD